MLSTLAVDSEALLRQQVGSSGIPFLQRSFEELEAENAKLASFGGLRTEAEDVAMLEPNRMSSSSEVLSGQHMGRLQRIFQELERRSAYARVEESGDGEDLEMALGDRAQQVVATAIEGAIGDALGEAERLAASQAAEAWEREKQHLLGEMGLKALPWQLDAGSKEEWTPSSGHALDEREAALGEVVRKLNSYAMLSEQARTAADERGTFRVFAEFGSAASRSRSASWSAWRIGHGTAREGATRPVVKEPLLSAASATRRAAAAGEERWLARGRRLFLETIFAEHVAERLVQSAEALRAHLMGPQAYEAGDDASRFTALEAARGQLPRPTIDHPLRARGAPVWPQIYVALRSGGASAATTVAEACRNALESGRPELLECTVDALRARAIADTEEELEGWLIDPRLRAAERSTAHAQWANKAAHLRAAIDAAGPDGLAGCPYAAVVLELAAAGSDDGESARRVVLRTVEDYLWHRLWRACLTDGSPSEAADAVARFGARHFDPTGDRPFQYAAVLLHAGAPQAALSHIAAAGLARDALHLALAYDSYGLLRSDHHRPSPPPKKNKSSEDAPFELGTFLKLYARIVAVADPALGIEYLGWLISRDNLRPKLSSAETGAMDELRRSLASFDEYGLLASQGGEDASSSLLASLVSLIIDTRAPAALVGSMDGATQARDSSNASLDTHLATDLVHKVLAAAARCAKARGDAALALRLLELAGDHFALLDLLVDQLARLVAKTDDRDRQTWLTLARDYADRRLVQSTAVLHALAAANKYDAGNTFQLLLNLAVFFDKCDDRKHAEALHILDNVKPKLIPASESDLGPLFDNAANLDRRITNLIPDLLLKAADCLYALHKRHQLDHDLMRRGQPSSSSPASNDQPDKELVLSLRRRAELFVNFAALVKIRIPPDVRQALARYEAMII